MCVKEFSYPTVLIICGLFLVVSFIPYQSPHNGDW